MTLYQVVLEHVYLGVFLCVVGGVTMVVGDRGRAVVLMFGGVRVEDVHRALLLGLRGLCRVFLLLRLILWGELLHFYTCLSTHRQTHLCKQAEHKGHR